MQRKQRKLRLGRGAAFVKRRLLWLPQEDVVREADFCRIPEALSHGNEMWLGLTVSQRDSSILSQAVLDHAPDVNSLANLLANAMQRPLMEQGSCRPKAIHLRTNPEWEELFPHLEQLDITVVVTEELSKWDRTAADLIDYLQTDQWKETAEHIWGRIEGVDELDERLSNLRAGAILYPSFRRTGKKE